MDWMTLLTKQLPSLASAFAFASATYGFFLWLDKKASGPANTAFSGLLTKQYDEAAVRRAILEMFDRVYTRPLLSFRAFGRSALITLVLTIITLYELNWFSNGMWSMRNPAGDKEIALNLPVNVIADFSALFIIRILLARAVSPTMGLVIAPTIGIFIVLAILILRIPLELVLRSVPLDQIPERFPDELKFFLEFNLHHIYGVMTISALAVHLWLPFFALCVGLVKGLNYFLLAANTARWFLKRGKDHPLDAVGFVAAPLMFLGTAAVQLTLR